MKSVSSAQVRNSVKKSFFTVMPVKTGIQMD